MSASRSSHLRSTIALLAFSLLFLTSPAAGQAILDSITVSPTTVDVSGGSQFVNTTSYLRSTPGLWYVFVSLGDPDSSSMLGFGTLTSGTPADGAWDAQIFVLQSTAPGTYPVIVRVMDSSFVQTDINTGKTVQVTGGDAQPPVLLGTPSVIPAAVDVGAGPQDVVVDVTLEDSVSGLLFVEASFRKGDSATAASASAALVSGDSTSGTWRAQISVPQWASGVYDLNIWAYDRAVNFLDTTFPSQLTVSGGDTVLPSVVGTPSVDKPSVNLTGADEDVKVTLTAADTYTGIASVDAWFQDTSSNSSGSSYSSVLLSGDSLSGTWELTLTFYGDMPAGSYSLTVLLEDDAGNTTSLDFPSVTVQVTRAPETDVTFILDARLFERLGLFLREQGGGPSVRIFGGPDSGETSLADADLDSLWTATVTVNAGQLLHYAFAYPSAYGFVTELDGEAGGRSVQVDSGAPLILPAVSFDNLPLAQVDAGYASVVRESFDAGNPQAREMNLDTVRTFTSVDFTSLDRTAIVAVRRYAHTGGGTAPPGIAVVAPQLYWGIASAPSGANFTAALSFDYDFFGGVTDPSALRLLRRADAGQPWEIVATMLNADEGTLEATGLTGFSEWTIGSTTGANTLIPEAPGLVSVPNPPDSGVGAGQNPVFSWNAAPGAYFYDLYVWPAGDTMPPVPSRKDLLHPTATLDSALAYGQAYQWRVVARNIAGGTPGPAWSFSTVDVADLLVSDIQAPPGAFSGQGVEISWTVTNAGAAGTNAQAWTDYVYLSLDSVLAPQVDPLLGQALNASALGAGESYTTTKTFIVPNGIFGTYRIIVRSDWDSRQAETDETNNLGFRDISVTLTPPPDLRVDVVSVPASGFSGQEIPLLYTVKNYGTNSTTSALWYDAVYLSADTVLSPQIDRRLLLVHRTAVLPPDSSYSVSQNARLPDTVSGAMSVFVVTDFLNHVSEFGLEDNNTRRADLTVSLSPPPDLVVTGVSAPASGNSGEPAQVQWTVTNQGSADAFAFWSDRVLVGPGPSFNPDSSVVVGTFSRLQGLARDSSYTRQAGVTLPNGIEGQFYIFVEADWKNEVYEYTFESNNVLGAAAATDVSLSPWPDLTVASVSAPASATANDVITVSWTVENSGAAAISSGSWSDSIYLSASASFDSSARLLTGAGRSGPLGPAAVYAGQASIRLPADLPGGTRYVHVVTDRAGTVYEHTGESNNATASSAIGVSAYPPVDLSVGPLVHGSAGASGTPFPIEFTVTNAGSGTTLSDAWVDVVFLSPDTVLDYSDDVRLARIGRASPLAAGEGYARSISPVLPDGISGNYHLFIRTDSASAVGDSDPSNNTRRSAGTVALSLSPPPDLTAALPGAPTSADAGQPISIVLQTGNAGAEVPGGRTWIDALYLSSDAAADIGDVRLATIERSGPMANGGSRLDTVAVTIPAFVSGPMYLLVKADSRNEVYEHNSESNNTAAALLTVSLPPPADLVVNSIAAPPTGTVGEDVTIEWIIGNAGVNPATGWATDAVYFSADTAWDLGDLLLGTATRQIDIAPGASSAAALTASLAAAALTDSSGSVTDEAPGLFPGAYFVIVRTDVRNNIRESDDGNNRRASGSTVAIDVPVLTVGVEDTGSISSASPRYYRVDVPAGYDLRITATSSVAYPSIDLFAAFGRMPTGNDYDERTADPTSLERVLFVPSTQAGSYYLMLRSIIDPSGILTETYSVVAETLGFSVESVSPEKGGSGGFVSGTIRGAGFRNTSRVFLYSETQEVAEGEVREFRSTMELAVRWDLRGVPLGAYDVEVRNQDSSTARLDASFTVEPMLDPVISIGKTVPRVLLAGRTESYALRFTNTSNVDIQYYFGLIAVPAGTEIGVETDSDLLFARSELVPDSLVPEGEQVEDWIGNGTARFIPLIGRGLPPGGAHSCRVSFRNAAYEAGTNFPMYVSVKTATKEHFLEIQLGQIEAYRAQVLASPAGHDPEYAARANDPVEFSQYALGAYVTLGLLDSADVPGVGIDQIAAAAAWGGKSRSAVPSGAGQFVPRLPSPLVTPDPLCVEFFNFIACPAAIIDCFIDLPFIPPPVSLGLCAFGVVTSCFGADFGDLNYIGCIGVASGLTCLGKEFLCRLVASSYDPNDITGPDGVGDERWVARSQTLPYTIRFENDSAKAIVPARRVTVTQRLDTTADLRSIRIGSFGFGRHVFQAPDNVPTWSGRLDLRDSMGIFVDVTAGIDIVNGTISWTFNTIDPVTGDAPADPFAGFLAVNDSTGSGQGFVSYTVRPSPSAKTLDTIHAEATIVFDINDPINTPAIFNVVDAVAPSSSVRPLEPVVTIESFPVHWGGTDDSTGSGLKHFTIYYSKDGGPYTAWLTNVTDTIAVFNGSDSSVYSFFSIAADVAGNTEAIKSAPEATTSIIVGVEGEAEELPKTFALAQNYPNPFNPTTIVHYDVPAAAWVRLAVYNVLGQEVAVLVNGEDTPGRKSVEWSAVNRHGLALPSGVYFYRMEATGAADRSLKFLDVKKMMLVR